MNGRITFKYGKLGEVIENFRTFALPFENQTYTFAMQYKYDSWNRIQEMTYPDGERVRYGYNLGGMLSRVTGQKDGRSYHYIDSIHYNRFELKEGVWYGNGTRVTYDYDSLQRLSRLQSACADGAMQDIAYTYDSVGNILRIENGAGTLSNGLGGTYSDTYTYDNLYRLSFAEGSWLGNHSLQYETASEYEKNGRIAWKSLSASTWLNGHLATELYSNEYHYNNPGQPNTLSDINEESGQQFEWDALGNMTRHVQSTTDRRLCWDEQNRLQGVKDNRYLSYYQYDAGGDRTYMLTGKGELQNISGNWQYYYLLDNATLYASPYLVATDRGYTKHYYAESERIASRIGGGGLGDALGSGDGNEELLVTHQAHFAEHFDAVMDCLGADAQPAEDLLKSLYNWLDSVQDEKDCYWYHPDHLGSSSWITFSDGSAVQHLHYLPWGEDFVDQRSSNWNAMYTFSAKEKDTETGYSYFGARYYSSDLSIWLSVDPMSDKYPSLSPYVYCADNPVKLVDPEGEDIILYFYLGKNGESSSKLLAEIINKGLEGQFKTKFTKNKDGKYVLSLTPTDNGGNVSKMSAEAKAFYEELSSMINDHNTEASIDVVYGSEDVAIGNYNSNKIDIADIDQFDNMGEGLCSKQGKLIHELVEQFGKAKDGVPKGSNDNYQKNHKKGIVSENKVNGSIRGQDRYDRGVYKTTYSKNGHSTTYSYSTAKPIIKVNKSW